MIYTEGFFDFVLGDLATDYNDQDIDKPSYPNKLRKLLPSVSAEYGRRVEHLVRNNSWINRSETEVELAAESITYIGDLGRNVSFRYVEIGSFISVSKIWRWAWANGDREVLFSSPAMTLRNYGFSNNYGFLTKSRYQADAESLHHIISLSTLICKGVGVEVREDESQLSFFVLVPE